MRSTVMVVGLAVASCAPPHVALRLPQNPTPEQRVAAYHALAAESEKTSWTTRCGQACTTDVQKTLYLANGTSVHYPEDLLPVLPANSLAVREVDQALTAKQRARYASMFAAASAVAGGLVFWHWVRASDERDDIDPTRGEAISLGAATLGLIVSVGFMYYYRDRYTDHFGAANRAYNDGLAEQLNVCVSGYALVACETLLPAAQ